MSSGSTGFRGRRDSDRSRRYRPRVSSIPRSALVLATCATLLIFLALCRSAAPQLDDYMVAAHAENEGLWSAQAGWYLHWHGKYFGMLSMSAFTCLFDIVEQYWLAPSLILMATWTALFALTRAVAPDQHRLRSIAVASVLLALYLAQIPEPQESIYWMTGAYAYQAGIVCALFLLALILSERRGVVGSLAGALLGLSVAGSSETLMLPAAALAGLWIASVLARRRASTAFGWSVAAALLAGGAAMVLAPGNAVRAAHFDGPTHELKRTFGRALEEAGEHFALFALPPAILGASLLFAGPLAAATRRLCAKVNGWHLALALALLASTFVPAFWATGYGPPPRAMAPVWAVFAAGWMFVVVPLVARCCEAKGWSWPPALRQNLGALLLSFGLFFPANTLTALDDLSSVRAAKFAGEVLQRDLNARLEAAQGDHVVRVPALRSRPASLFVGDFASDPKHGINVEAAAFFGVESFAVRPPQ